MSLRASLLLASVGFGAACGLGDVDRFDLRGLQGPAALVRVSEDNRLVRSLGVFRIVEGRASEALDLDGEVPGGDRSRLLLLPEPSSDLGPLLWSRSEVRDRVEPATMAGSQLGFDFPLEPATTRVLGPADGPPREVPAVETAELLSRIRLRLEVETEPCPPPLPSLSPFSPPVFPEADQAVVGLDPRGYPDALIVGHRRRVAAVDREGLIDSQPLPSRKAILEGFAALPGGKLLAFGGLPYERPAPEVGGWIWTLERVEGRLVQGPPAAVLPIRLMDLVHFQNRLLALDFEGTLYAAPEMAGPWTKLADGLAPPIDVEDRSLVRGPDDQLVRVLNSAITPVPGATPSWPIHQFNAQDLGPTGIEAAAFDPQGHLWVATERADLFHFDGETSTELARSRPPRFAGCAFETTALDEVTLTHLSSVGTVVVDGTLYQAFDRCNALYTLRTEDRCPGVLTSAGAAPAPPASPNELLRVRDGRLFLVQRSGAVLVTSR